MNKNYYSRLVRHKKWKQIKIFLIIIIVFIGLFVVFKAPLFNKNVRQRQYRLNKSGLLELITIDVAIAEPEKQSLVEKISEPSKQKPIPLAENPFFKWSVLENFDAGYRLIYPAGFTLNYENEAVEIRPPSDRGKIVVYIKDKTFEVKVFLEDASGEEDLLKSASQLVKESFEFIDSRGYNLEEVKQRFNEE